MIHITINKQYPGTRYLLTSGDQLKPRPVSTLISRTVVFIFRRDAYRIWIYPGNTREISGYDQHNFAQVPESVRPPKHTLLLLDVSLSFLLY